ncbi:hypothetical protein [Actinomyces qiguomingii]|uniref:hypothetical protein n=1 Tax=Actinomyces qiguomingii TaxID=2057800 RepID=UPI000CA063A1|nr:hypothetical protein [Actinomyces qiguomingii]
MTITLTAAKSFTPEPYFQAARGLASQARTVKDVADGITSVQSLAAEDWRGGWDNGGGRYPRHEPGGDDKVNRYPDGREY